jgi:hypothetical protein
MRREADDGGDGHDDDRQEVERGIAQAMGVGALRTNWSWAQHGTKDKIMIRKQRMR